MQSAVFVDRDDTLIRNSGDLGDPDLVELLPGVADGLKSLREAGYRLIVVTNQGGVARGRYSEDDVDRVHRRIAELVDDAAGEAEVLDRFYYCPYHPKGTVESYRREHFWRKPRPGMLLQAARDLDLDLASSWMIGDQMRDIEAGRAAGCRTILMTDQPAETLDGHPTATSASFGDAASVVVKLGGPVSPEGGPGPGQGPNGAGPRVRSARASAARLEVERMRGRLDLDGETPTSAGATAVLLGDAPAPAPAAALAAAPALAARTASPAASTTSPAEPEPSAMPDAAAATERPARPAAADRSAPPAIDPAAGEELRHAVRELVDELRSERQRRAEFSGLRLTAGLVQLAALLLATLSILQFADDAAFLRWFGGAILAQLLVIALLVGDNRS
ncbi:MAG: D-glycero-alpha-D-manno-heptose-1,7-bisphosphate 7-phosphatase [Phycisphaerales bacterium]